MYVVVTRPRMEKVVSALTGLRTHLEIQNTSLNCVLGFNYISYKPKLKPTKYTITEYQKKNNTLTHAQKQP